MLKNGSKIGVFALSISFLWTSFGVYRNYNEYSDYNSVFVLPKICLSNKKDDCYYLIGRKAAKKHKGMWTLIGGKRENWESEPVITAKREFNEETLSSFDNGFLKMLDRALKLNKALNIGDNTGNIAGKKLYIINIKGSKKVVIIADMPKKSFINGSRLFYKKLSKLLLEDPNLIEIDKLALVKISDLKEFFENTSNPKLKTLKPKSFKARIIEPDVRYKIDNITLRSSAYELLKEIV